VVNGVARSFVGAVAVGRALMGLDVYVGPLSRYYTGQWETIIQQYARQTGMEVRVVRPPNPRRSIIGSLLSWVRPSAGVEQKVAQWRREVSRVAGSL
jgi:hypothetical protein